MSARVRVLAAALIHGQPAAAKARRLEWGVRTARGRRGGRLAGLREVDVERDGSLQNRVATGKAAQADQSALAGCDRAAGRRHEGGETEATTRLGERIGQFERPGRLELRGQPPAIVVRRRGQRRFGQVHRPPAPGSRPFHTRPLPGRREQVDEAGIDCQTLAVDHLGIEGHHNVLGRADRLDQLAPDHDRSRVMNLPRRGDDLRILDRVGKGIAISRPRGVVVSAREQEPADRLRASRPPG